MLGSYAPTCCVSVPRRTIPPGSQRMPLMWNRYQAGGLQAASSDEIHCVSLSRGPQKWWLSSWFRFQPSQQKVGIDGLSRRGVSFCPFENGSTPFFCVAPCFLTESWRLQVHSVSSIPGCVICARFPPLGSNSNGKPFVGVPYFETNPAEPQYEPRTWGT